MTKAEQRLCAADRAIAALHHALINTLAPTQESSMDRAVALKACEEYWEQGRTVR